MDARASSTKVLQLDGATREAKAALGGRVWAIGEFPFRFGRAAGPRDAFAPDCEVKVVDDEPYKVSRRHCRIIWHSALATYFVEDTDSKLGTLVNGVGVGRQRGHSMRAALSPGANRIILGGEDSPFEFIVTVPFA